MLYYRMTRFYRFDWVLFGLLRVKSRLMSRKSRCFPRACLTNIPHVFVLLIFLSGEALSKALDIKDYERHYEKALASFSANPQQSFAYALEIVESSTSPLLKAQALNILGLLTKKQKEYQQALSYHNEAYDLALAGSDFQVSVDSLLKIADVHRHTKDYDRGLSFIQMAA